MQDSVARGYKNHIPVICKFSLGRLKEVSKSTE